METTVLILIVVEDDLVQASYYVYETFAALS